MIKCALVMAVIGHILCGICDCLLGYSGKKRLNFKCINDQEKMAEMFEDMPLSNPMISTVLGTFAIALFGFGYFALSEWMKGCSTTAANIMFIASVLFTVSIVVHHVICGVVEWIYIRLDRKDEVRKAVLQFQKETISTMLVGYASLVVFVVTLFVMIISGKTDIPSWGCIFNTLVLMLILLPTKLPAKGNIAGALMYLGLLFLI